MDLLKTGQPQVLAAGIANTHDAGSAGPALLVARSAKPANPSLTRALSTFFSGRLSTTTAAKASRLIADVNPECVIFEISGEQSLRQLARLQAVHGEILIVALVTDGGTNAALRAMREGAADFVLADSNEPLHDQLSGIYLRQAKRLRRTESTRTTEVDLFLGTSHDLKGPLGVILTSAELLGTLAADPDRQRHLMNCIASSARGAIGLIDSIVSVRRVHEGALTLYRQPLNVRSLIETLVSEYGVVADAHHVRMTVSPIDPQLTIAADKLCMSRVLANLVHNAIKYSAPRGQVTIRAREYRGGIEIAIADNGQGIPKEKLSTLFKRFSRLSEHRAIDGSGIGLYVSQALTKAHGGVIRVRSRAGEGSVFSIRLPYPPVTGPCGE